MSKQIQFKDVQLFDRVYDPGYYAAYKWRSVTEIEEVNGQVILALGVRLSSTASDTRTRICGHPKQGIDVERDEWEQ